MNKEQRLNRDINIVKDYMSGMSLKDISEKYSITTNTVSTSLLKSGIKKPYSSKYGVNGVKECWGTRKSELVHKYDDIINWQKQNNATLQETGNHFGVTRERVRQILKERGIVVSRCKKK